MELATNTFARGFRRQAAVAVKKLHVAILDECDFEHLMFVDKRINFRLRLSARDEIYLFQERKRSHQTPTALLAFTKILKLRWYSIRLWPRTVLSFSITNDSCKECSRDSSVA